MAALDLFDGAPPEPPRLVREGVVLFVRALDASALLAALAPVIEAAPLRQMETPGGRRMAVAMTNCGVLGWISDRKGYRYTAHDPASGKAWPAIPGGIYDAAVNLAARAGYPGFDPDACLVNRYVPGTQLSLHQDRNECDFGQPIVSFSFGLPATFLLGRATRSAPTEAIRLAHGDALVFGGPARLAFHGVRKLDAGVHPTTGACRINLTLRRAG